MRVLTFLFMTFAPLSALADALCEELWLTRNTVFDRAEYCFGSPLGKAVFDNSDCTTSAPKLSAADETLIATVREIEADFSCRVDTQATSLGLDNVDLRRSLNDLPVKTGYESACLNYTGEPLLLTAGRHPDTPFFGEIFPGDDVLFGHIPVDGMDFIDLGDGRMGWVGSGLITPEQCAGGVAG